jgi:hypothetical protein
MTTTGAAAKPNPSKYPDLHCSRCGSGHGVHQLSKKTVVLLRARPKLFDFRVPAAGEVYICAGSAGPRREGCFGVFREMFAAASVVAKRRLLFKMVRVWTAADDYWHEHTGPGPRCRELGFIEEIGGNCERCVQSAAAEA